MAKIVDCPKCEKFYKEKNRVMWNYDGFWDVLYGDEVGISKEQWKTFGPEQRKEIYQKMLKDFNAIPFLNEDGTPHYRCLATFIGSEVAKKFFEENNLDFSVEFMDQQEESKGEKKGTAKKTKKTKKIKKKLKKEKTEKEEPKEKKDETKEEPDKKPKAGKTLMSFKQTMEIVTGTLLKVEKIITTNNEILRDVKKGIERLKTHLEEVYKEYNIPNNEN